MSETDKPSFRQPSPKRQKSFRRGRSAETIVLWWLRLKGYRLVAKNFKTPVGEIDLIVRRGRVLVIVEVKTRTNRDDALAAITAQQQKRIGRAAQIFLQQHPEAMTLSLRFDAVFLSPGRLPLHFVNAWRLP